MADVEINLTITNPQELIGLGLRAFVIGDFSNAAAAFGRATQLMAEKNGDEHDSLGDVYIHYARSLLELAREESGPLGDAIPQVDDDSDSDDEEEETSPSSDQNPGEQNRTEEENVEAQVAVQQNAEAENPNQAADVQNDTDRNGVALNGVVQNGVEQNGREGSSKDSSTRNSSSMATSSYSSSSSGISSSQNSSSKENSPNKEESAVREDPNKKESPKNDKTDDKKEEIGESSRAEIGEPSTSGAPKEEPANEELQDGDCSDLQLAWEVLEVAKKIFTKRGDSGKERLAEALILLGEIAMESENFTDGINDMKAGLEMQKGLFEPTSRKLAETYYKLGSAHSTLSNIDEAVECFKHSIDILKKRIDSLKSSLGENKTDKVNNQNEEIEEMTGLIPEIEEKISDTKSIKEEMTAKLIQEMSGEKKTSPIKEDEAGPSTSNRPNDISHLVKRKRKSDEDTPEKEIQPAKRPTP